MTFQEWWNKVGSGITPFESDDMESFAHRIAHLAWMTSGGKIYIDPDDEKKQTENDS